MDKGESVLGKLGRWRKAAVRLPVTRGHSDSERIIHASPRASLQILCGALKCAIVSKTVRVCG